MDRQETAQTGSDDDLDLDQEIVLCYQELEEFGPEDAEKMAATELRLRELQAKAAEKMRRAAEATLAMPIDFGRKLLAEYEAFRERDEARSRKPSPTE